MSGRKMLNISQDARNLMLLSYDHEAAVGPLHDRMKPISHHFYDFYDRSTQGVNMINDMISLCQLAPVFRTLKQSYKFHSKTGHAENRICTDRNALQLYDFARRSSDSPTETKYIFFKIVIMP